MNVCMDFHGTKHLTPDSLELLHGGPAKLGGQRRGF